MSTLTINGSRVVTGSITIPRYGTWSADVVMAETTEIDSAATLVAGDLTLVGTVIRQAAFAGSRTARIVGGAGGWRTELPAKGYSHIIGVKLSAILGDAARAAGETIVVDPDRGVGTHYARDAGKAESVLNLLLDGQWWVDTAGVTQMSERDSSAIATPFTVVSWSGAKGQFEIASEAIAAWQPGRTFTTSTVPTVQTISSVTLEATNDGKLRLHVLSADGDVERLRSSLRALIRSELAAVNYAGVWEYQVAASVGLGLTATIDCTPTDLRMPTLTRVPVVGIGVVAPPIAGTSCRIHFVNSDPSRPECISLGDTTEHYMTTEATALLIYNCLVALMAAAGGGPLLAAVLQPLLGAAITAALTAQAVPAPPGLIAQTAAAAALQAGFATGVAPSNAIFAAWLGSTALLGTKALDVSGYFPSVGVPNG